MFSLTSKEYVSRESMLIFNLDHKQLQICVITNKNIAVQIRGHLSSKIFDIYFSRAKFTDIIYKIQTYYNFNLVILILILLITKTIKKLSLNA